jgi:TonB family protein
LCAILVLAPALLRAQSQTGSIDGRVLTATGEPAAGIRVAAVTAPQTNEPGASTSTLLSGFVRSDAAGNFRLENLPAGRYLVMAGSLDTPIYHPGVILPEKATIVSVPSGGTVTGIEFPLKAYPTVSGRLVDRSSRGGDGQLVIRLESYTSTLLQTPERVEATVDAGGRFRFWGVRPGKYTIAVFGRNLGEPVTIDVLDEDIAGLDLVVFPVAQVLTNIRFNGEDGPEVLFANCMKCEQPDYPRFAREANIGGIVEVLITIRKDGRVLDSRVVNVVSGHLSLQQSAQDVVTKWRLKPRMENGEPVESTASVSFTFQVCREVNCARSMTIF